MIFVNSRMVALLLSLTFTLFAHAPTSVPQAAIAPELTGISSSTKPHGIIDRINRALFGGRLIYFGPAYLFNILGGPINFFNTTRCWVVNPWAYNRAACKKLYDSTLEIISQIEREMGLGAVQSEQTASAPATGAIGSTAKSDATGAKRDSSVGGSSGGGSMSNGSGSAGQPASAAVGGSDVVYPEAVTGGGLRQRQQQAAASAAPMGVDDTVMIRSLEALPARGS